jgi:hypothetical protein
MYELTCNELIEINGGFNWETVAFGAMGVGAALIAIGSAPLTAPVVAGVYITMGASGYLVGSGLTH